MTPPNRIPGERVLRMAALLFLLLATAGAAAAASVEVAVEPNPVHLNESFQITFTVHGEVQGAPDFSVLEKEFQVLGTSRSLRTTFVNGKMERTDQYLVSALAKRAGKLTVPPVSFGKEKSPPVTVEVIRAPAAAKGKGDLFIEVAVDEKRPYVQQQVILTVRIFHRIQWRQASLSEPHFQGGGVLAEQLGKDRNYQALRDGLQWQVIERRYALFPQASGKLEMDPLVLDLRVPSGRRAALRRPPFGDPFFDDFFSRQNTVRRVVRSRPLALEVKPVPPAYQGKHWLPARHLRLQEQWSKSPDRLEAGEPVTRTLTLTADGVSRGELPDLELPPVAGVRIYPDDPKIEERAVAGGVRASQTRKFALIPVKQGEYELPAVELHWWNLDTDSEAVARLPARRLRVAPGAAGGGVDSSAPPAPATAPAPASSAPAAIASTAPPAAGNWVPWLAASNLALLALWLVTLVAWLRARGKGGDSPSSKREETERRTDAPRRAWKRLRQAAAGEDAKAMRQALLELAPLLWRESPPRSLEAMARRLDPPLAAMLLGLSRQLYGEGSGTWDGKAIEAGLKRLAARRKEDEARPAAGALKPLYPG